MSDLRTEEEQIEALKQWWAQWSRVVSLSVLVAVGSYLAWHQYQSAKQATGEQAQVLYHALLELRRAAEANEEQSEAQEQSVIQAQLKAIELKQKFEQTPYAVYAALFLARDAVESQDYDTAAKELRYALEHTRDAELQGVLYVRLARVLLAAGQNESALALVNKPPHESFVALYAEVEGDILVRMNRLKEARVAYQKALDQNTDQSSSYLAMKLADITEPPASSHQAQDSQVQTQVHNHNHNHEPHEDNHG